MANRAIFVYDSLDVDPEFLEQWDFEYTYAVPLKATGKARNKIGADDFVRGAKGHRAVLGASGALITRDVMESLPDLRFVAKLGIGYDVIDVSAATDCGIVVTNTPIHREVGLVAEHAVALILACMKQFHWYNTTYVRQGGWRDSDHLVRSLEGATVGIIGFGNIGRAVAQRLVPFGAQIVTYDIRAVDPVNGVEQVELDELLARSDVVTLHAPPNKSGELLGSSQLELMKQGAILVNTARGALVDNNSLAKQLESGHLRGAGIDVYFPEPPSGDGPLLQAPNTFLTPHVAAWNEQVRIDMTEMALASLAVLFDGGISPCVVNPEVYERGVRP